jgi:hypothetical protein
MPAVILEKGATPLNRRLYIGMPFIRFVRSGGTG